MHAVERDIHLSGATVPETSYYPALANLLKRLPAVLWMDESRTVQV